MIAEFRTCVTGLRGQIFSVLNSYAFRPVLSNAPCQKLSVRKEWRDMSNNEKRRFIVAFNTPVFLPWHRAFLEYLETLLQKVDPSVTIPFWDWGFDGQHPTDDTDIFSSSPLAFGTRGNPSANPPCISDGFARNWTSGFGVCLSRNYTDDFTLYDTSIIAPLVNNTPDFASFAGPLETAHNIVHYYTGGFGTDLFFIDLSPNDPLFFLLHANVDRYWYLWQKAHPDLAMQYTGSAQLPPFSGQNIAVSPDDLMPGFNQAVSTALLTDSGGDYCSTYAPYSGSTSPPLRRRAAPRPTPFVNLRASSPVPVGSGRFGTRKRVPPGPLPEEYIRLQHQRMFGMSMANSGRNLAAIDLGKGKPVAIASADKEKNFTDDESMAAARGLQISSDSGWTVSMADSLGRIRKNEAILQAIAAQFDATMDDYLAEHPTAAYEEAFKYVVSHWQWHNYV
ncbi:hypothetical protein HDU96_000026 [Phlyctochytrium bullatum]|nr:hypothetical protein HDU96_000026 [Phlyctochytrium bullatum]